MRALALAIAFIATTLSAAEPEVSCGGDGPLPLCRIDAPDGTALTEYMFEIVNPFREGLAPVRVDGLWGYVAADGAWVIEPQFHLAGPFVGPIAEVFTGEAVGIIDRSGSFVVPPSLARAAPLTDDVIMAVPMAEPLQRSPTIIYRAEPPRADTSGLMRIDGTWLTEPIHRFFDIATGTPTLWASIPTPGSGIDPWGLMDATGAWLIEPSFDNIRILRGTDLTIVDTADGSGLIGPDGTVLLPPEYSRIRGLTQNHVALRNTELKWGVATHDGTIVVPLEWDDATITNGAPTVSRTGVLTALRGRAATLHLHPDGTLQADPPEAPSEPDTPRPRLGSVYAPNNCQPFTENGLWGLRAIDGADLPAIHRAILCRGDGVALVPDEDTGQWCPMGRDNQLRTGLSQCRFSAYPRDLEASRSERPVEMDDDPFDSNILWVRALLDHLTTDESEAPLVISGGDGEQRPFQCRVSCPF